MKKGALILKNGVRQGTIFPVWGGLAVTAASIFPGVALTQPISDLGSASKISMVPRISITETYTSNALLSASAPRAELITEISPGIHMSSHGGRISGSLDYSLRELLYARNSSGRRSENSLNALGTIEVLDKSGYIDFSAVVTQQAISAFGAPTDNLVALNANRTETSVFRVSPRMRGTVGGLAEYDARYSLISSQSQDASASDVDSTDLSLQLHSLGSRIGAGWTFGFNRQGFDYSLGRSTQAQQLNGQVNYPFNRQWGVYIKGGRESNNYIGADSLKEDFAAVGVNWTPSEETRVSIDKDSRGAIGVVANWAPSKRTSVSIIRERRLYGDTHSIALSYRTPNTAWTFNDTRSAATSLGQAAGSSAPSLYDVLYGQFLAVEVDPVKREQYDAFLQANGIKPNATAVGGFLTSSVSLQRQQQLSFALFGARSTLSLIATRSSNTKLDTLATGLDDFSNSPLVVQNGLSANYSYRLTPKSLLSVIATRQVSSGSLAQPGTSSRTINVNLSTILTRETSASISARRVVFDSTTAPYTETAVIGSVSVQF